MSRPHKDAVRSNVGAGSFPHDPLSGGPNDEPFRALGGTSDSGSAAQQPVRLTCLEAFNQELNYIFRTLYRLGIPAADVEDLAQDIFLAMRTAWAAYDPRRPVRPYIYGITYNVAMLYRRKHHREVAGEVPDLPDAAPAADDAFDSHHIRNIVVAALQMIPLPRRAVLVMHEIDGVPVADVARGLSLSLFTVYSRLRKARVEFKVAVRRLLRQIDGGWTGPRRRAVAAR